MDTAGDALLDRSVELRCVVAVVLRWRGRLGLFKRSPLVGGGAGLWHCITGYLDSGVAPLDQVPVELREETGLAADEVFDLREHATLDLADPTGHNWRVHVCSAETTRKRLVMNWEHVSYRWVPEHEVPRFDGQVPWLHDVLGAIR